MSPVPKFDLLDKARRHCRTEVAKYLSPAATPAGVVKHALDTALDAIADIERRASRPPEPKPDSANLFVN
jgi:hypothetical protein